MGTHAVWVWLREDRPLSPVAAARFARERGVRAAWVSVPWDGPTEVERAMVGALRAEGITVAALGSGADWPEHPDRAEAWARRALTEPGFTSVHLDIEPWARTSWPAGADELLAGTAQAITLVAGATGLPVEVDLAPRVAMTHPVGFTRVAGAAGAVTLMSYRTTAAAILDFASPAVAVLRELCLPYRLAVDTLPSPHPDTTFAGKPPAYLEQVTRQVSERLSGDPVFTGFAVHDLRGWVDLPA